VPIPALQPGEVLIKVEVALTDGTDLKVFPAWIPRAHDRAGRRCLGTNWQA